MFTWLYLVHPGIRASEAWRRVERVPVFSAFLVEGRVFYKRMNTDERDEDWMLGGLDRAGAASGHRAERLPRSVRAWTDHGPGQIISPDENSALKQRTPWPPPAHPAFIPFICVHPLIKNASLRQEGAGSRPPVQTRLPARGLRHFRASGVGHGNPDLEKISESAIYIHGVRPGRTLANAVAKLARAVIQKRLWAMPPRSRRRTLRIFARAKHDASQEFQTDPLPTRNAPFPHGAHGIG